jgi:hypothetical protein
MPELSSLEAAVPVEIESTGGRHQLLRDGRPYHIKGAGISDAGEIEKFAEQGGNSLRVWTTNNGALSTGELLDRAHEHGVTVALCIEMGIERLGFDYTDRAAVSAQLEYARGEATKYKDHPALLFWIIGNELNHSFTNPAIFDAINDVSRMIHEVDGNHPTTSALSGFSADLVEVAEERAPDLDFLSFQLYGGIEQLPNWLEKSGFNKPFMITEWGTTGHWEVESTEWGAPIELSSSQKASRYLERYNRVVSKYQGQIIGSYVFLWGQKQERTPTWYSMILEDGAFTEVTDVMHYIWNGAWPANLAPQVGGLSLDSREALDSVVLRKAHRYEAFLDAEDPEGGTLTYRWSIMRESEATQEGGDPEVVPETLAGLIKESEAGRITMTAPAEPGYYRLFAYVYDDGGKAGHANIPFMVE